MSTISASNANNNNNVARKQTQSVPRVSSATLKYYDIATQLLGKAGSDLEELFIAAARVSHLTFIIDIGRVMNRNECNENKVFVTKQKSVILKF